MTRTEMNRQFALSQAVAFHSGTPRNVTADNVVDMAKTFESYLNGDTDASLSK